MMINRTTQPGLQMKSLAHLQNNLQRLSTLQERLSSGKVLTRASDDPAAAVDSLRIRSEQRENAQFQRNAGDGVGWLSTIDNTLTSSLPLVTRARNLVLTASNDTVNAVQREAFAAELDGLAETLVGLANTQYGGRSVFAGTSTAGRAYTTVPDAVTGRPTYVFEGVEGSKVERRLSATEVVRVDSNGANVWGIDAPADGTNPATQSLFGLITDIADKLRAGEDVRASLDGLDKFQSKILSEAGAIGTRYNQTVGAQDALTVKEGDMKTRLSAVEDADLPATVVELGMAEVAYQTAIAATSRVLQPTLLDYIR